MTNISYLIQKILVQHVDRETGIPEVILIGYVDINVAEEHLARYLVAQRFSRGIILDIASGSGYGSSILARAKKSAYVISADISYDMLRYGAKVFNVNGVQADALKLPFRDGVFDTVVTLETVEHLPDPISFIKELFRVLKFDGLVVLSTPNKLYSSPFVKKPLNPYHVKEFYLGELEFILKQGGLEPCYVLCGKPFTKLTLIRRVIGTIIKVALKYIGIKPKLVDLTFRRLIGRSLVSKERDTYDPQPHRVRHYPVRSTTNIQFCEYFIVVARKQKNKVMRKP